MNGNGPFNNEQKMNGNEFITFNNEQPEFITFNNEQKMNGNDQSSLHLIMNRK